jgi:hypothetical protein
MTLIRLICYVACYVAVLGIFHTTSHAASPSPNETQTPMLTRRGFLGCSSALMAFGTVDYLGLSRLDSDKLSLNDIERLEAALRERSTMTTILSFLPGAAVNISVAKLADELRSFIKKTEGSESVPGVDDVTYTDTAVKASLLMIGKVLLLLALQRDPYDLRKLLGGSWQRVLETALVLPVKEEMASRLLPATVFGKSWSVGLLSALVFASAHGLEQIPITQFIGGVFYWYLMRERGLDHAILAHVSNNNMAAIANFLALKFP